MSSWTPSKKKRARERRAAERHHLSLEDYRAERGQAPDGTRLPRVHFKTNGQPSTGSIVS
jgi:hypothetical protein